jgi:hypothetical protein
MSDSSNSSLSVCVVVSRTIIACMLFVLSGFLLSCTEDDKLVDPPGEGDNLIIPLDVGNYWIYEVTIASNGIVHSRGEEQLEVIDQVFMENAFWFQLSNSQLLLGELYANTAVGLETSRQGGTSQMLLKYPAELEDEYTLNEGSGMEYSVTVLGADELITVPGGSYECYYYLFEHDKVWYNGFFYPGVGLIRWQFVDPPYMETWELKEYSIR